MTCPFLKEAQVKYCRTASVRKLIPLAQTGRTDEKCGSSQYLTCKVFQAQPPIEEASALGPCPYLRESLMQYCAAVSVTKLVRHCVGRGRLLHRLPALHSSERELKTQVE